MRANSHKTQAQSGPPSISLNITTQFKFQSLREAKHFESVCPRSSAHFFARDAPQCSDHFDDLDDRARLIPVLDHCEVVWAGLVLAFVLLWEDRLNVLRTVVRITYVAVWAIGFDHQPIERHLLNDFTVFRGLQAASINANVEVEIKNLSEFFFRSRETVHDTCRELVSVLAHDVNKLRSRSP